MINQTKQATKEAWLLYDGQCPVCNSFILRYRINKHVNLHLIDARSESAFLQEASNRKLDIDKGMVLKVDAQFYHGSEALRVLALLGTHSDLMNACHYYIFRSKILSILFYPYFRLCRSMLLKMRGIKKINNLSRPHD